MAKHRQVSDISCSDAGVSLMKIDAYITLRAVQHCQSQGMAVLPVHDSLIVPATDAERTVEILLRLAISWTNLVPRFQGPVLSHVAEKSETPIRPVGFAMGTGFFPSETILGSRTLFEFATLVVLASKNDPMLPDSALLPPATSIVARPLLKVTEPK